MASLVASDTFDRANTASGLGSPALGPAWTMPVGTMQIQTNRARATTNARAAAVIDAGFDADDVIVEADCGSGNSKGGYALYFRVTDANNWWRLAVNAGSYQYVSGSHQESYSYVSSYSCTTTTYNGWDWVQASSPSYFNSGSDQSGTTGNDQTYWYVTSCSPNYATGYTTVYDYSTAYTWDLMLQKCVAGTLTTVITASIPAAPTHLKVVASNAVITGFCSTTSDATVTQRLTATDAFNKLATKHGLGYGETTTSGNTDGLDNFTLLVTYSGFVGWGAPL